MEMPQFVRRMVSATVLVLLAAAPVWGGTVQLSTLGQPNFAAYNIGSGAMFAQSFTTGSAAGGWDLESVTLAMGDADTGMEPFNGTLGTFGVSIFASDPLSSTPTSLVAALSGSISPAVSGDYVYTATGTTLSANTQYWIVMTQTGGDSASYKGRMDTDSSPTFTTAINDWTLDLDHTTALSFDSGNSWTLFTYNSNSAAIFAVETAATPVPEPATWALFAGLGALGLVVLRRSQLRQPAA